MRLIRSVSFVLVAIALAAVSVACVGPTWSTADIMSAENALDEARLVNAEMLAPYEFHMAQELLRKANEEWGYADYGTGREYAERAKDFAEKARQKANTEPWNGPPASAIQQ